MNRKSEPRQAAENNQEPGTAAQPSGNAVDIFAMSAEQQFDVLSRSLYPGAKKESVALVLNYCRAARLDPMLKPVHIVPMKVSTGQKDNRGFDIKEERDVIMPGVGLYRIKAAETGQYSGIGEPIFGAMLTMTFVEYIWEEGEDGKRHKRKSESQIEYPEWCQITVFRNVAGTLCEFTAKEYWIENYAAKGDGTTPNAMWRKRPRAQLAKCAEAQALRKAFPGETGNQPTAEEMEGKEFDGRILEHDPTPEPKRIAMPQEKTPPVGTGASPTQGFYEGVSSEAQGEKPQPKEPPKDVGVKLAGGPPASPGARNMVKHKLGQQSQIDEAALCERFGFESLDLMPHSAVNEVLMFLEQCAQV